MAAPLMGLPPWLETPAIPPLAPIQSFFQGFSSGQQAAAAQANREQQAEQFGSELALRQAKAAQDYQQTQQEQQLRAQQLAAQLLHQRAMEQQAIENNESLRQHRLDLAEQAKIAGQRLQQQSLAQQAHWKALEDAAQNTVTPVMVDLPPRGKAYMNPKTGAIHVPPRGTEEITPHDKVVIIKDQIKEKEAELDSLKSGFNIFRSNKPDIDRVTNELNALKEERNSLGKAPKQIVPTRIRVRDKSSGKLGWWEGSEALPEQYEKVE